MFQEPTRYQNKNLQPIQDLTRVCKDSAESVSCQFVERKGSFAGRNRAAVLHDVERDIGDAVVAAVSYHICHLCNEY